MKKYLIALIAFLTVANTYGYSNYDRSTDEETTQSSEQPVGARKMLVVYFSQSGTTQGVAEQIGKLTGADLYRIQPTVPYKDNGYADSDKIKDESYNDRRLAIANLPDSEFVAQYDTIFVGSPCWWHQPAMVVCTFLDAYDLSGKTIIPFFTFGATTYLNESMQKIYKLTPNSNHIPAVLPEDLDPNDITKPGRPDDDGIAMPGNASGTESWLKRIGIIN